MADVRFSSKTALDFNILFEKEINHFVSCVKDKTPCRNPAQDGIDLMTILDAVYKSADTGHEVVLR